MSYRSELLCSCEELNCGAIPRGPDRRVVKVDCRRDEAPDEPKMSQLPGDTKQDVSCFDGCNVDKYCLVMLPNQTTFTKGDFHPSIHPVDDTIDRKSKIICID